MKKLLVVTSLLVVALACAAPPTNRQAASDASTNRAAEPAVVPGITQAEAIVKEEASWEALKTKNYSAFSNMLANDFIEVGGDGVYDKSRIVEYLKGLDVTEVTFSDWKMLPIDKDAVVLVYHVNIKGKFKGEDIPVGPYRASSAWVNRDGKWQAIYYQETLARSASTPSSSPGAATSASPITKAAESILPEDPIEREKMIWDALKRKDFETFASFLDESQIDVEPEGVFDKAATLNSVRGFDASSAELSDFHTVKITNQSSLVTYLVKVASPHPVQERASTIWGNRGGKWRALFHQGTPAVTPAAAASPVRK